MPEPLPNPQDVRMRGFAARATVEQAWHWLDAQLAPLCEEMVPLEGAAGRVLSQDIISSVDVPAFHRAMMDGYAVQAADTTAASAYNRLSLRVVGLALPGTPATVDVQRGTAVRIMTGAPLPHGADAVLPAELTDGEGDTIEVLDAVATGKHVGPPGEDVQNGTRVLPVGRRLRPQDLGVLSSIGIAQVPVVRRPHVRILVTGDELLAPGEVPRDCRITDANSPMLAALVQRDGGLPRNPGICADDPDAILDALHDEADVVLVSGGSSVGQEDYAPRLLAQHGELAVHGVAMRPSSPTGMGRLGRRLVFLLPGNPVSCLCAYDFFAGRAIRCLAGRKAELPYVTRELPLVRKLASLVGRVDYARVRIVDDAVEPLAISGASVLSSTTRADGFVIIPADSEGYGPGTFVKVYLYDAPG